MLFIVIVFATNLLTDRSLLAFKAMKLRLAHNAVMMSHNDVHKFLQKMTTDNAGKCVRNFQEHKSTIKTHIQTMVTKSRKPTVKRPHEQTNSHLGTVKQIKISNRVHLYPKLGQNQHKHLKVYLAEETCRKKENAEGRKTLN